MVVPLFKAGKIFFPTELKSTQALNIFIEQIALVTKDGIKGKDDCVDTVSMLQYMDPWKPSKETYDTTTNDYARDERVWGSNRHDMDDMADSNFSSYSV